MDRALMADRLEKFLSLTPRQQRMARRYAEGTSRRELAYQFFVTDDTVRGCLNTIYRRLDLTGSSQKHRGRELAYLVGFVDGHKQHRLRMVTHKDQEVA
jgi:DNA-binding CsgD family transcriptional regulator